MNRTEARVDALNSIQRLFVELVYNMEKIIVPALIITFLFALAKFVEMKFVEKKMKPLKYLVRDTVIVFVCALVAGSLYSGALDGKVAEFMNTITEAKILPTGATTEIFTGVPEF